MGFLDKLKGGKSKEKDTKKDDVVESKVEEEEDGSKPKGFGRLKGLFGGGNKKQKGIIDTMGLNEAVASMGLSVLEEVATSSDGSAVRELPEGYTAIAITEEMFQEMEVDVKSADFGSFANAIASEHIESLLLDEDLHNGLITIIPDRETLDILDEFSFIEDTIYRWVIVPFDIEDDSTVILLENGASLGDLNFIADNESTLVHYNGRITTAEQLDALKASNPEAEVPEPVATSNVIEDNVSDDFSDFDEDEEDDVFGDLLGDDEVESFDDTVDSFDSFEEADEFDAFDDFEDDFGGDFDTIEEDVDFGDDFGDFDDFDDEDDLEIAAIDDLDDIDDEDDDLDYLIEDTDESISLQSLDEGQEMIEGVVNREFNNDELGLSIQADAFNQQFGDVKPILFDTSKGMDGLLSESIVEMRMDANTRIKTMHNTNMQKLRSVYQNGLSDIHDKLVSILDYKDADTSFGERFISLEHSRDERLDQSDELVASSRDVLDRAYNERRDDYGDRAKREALSKYDDQYKKQHEDEKRNLGEEVESVITLEFDSELSELYEERRDVASRIFDKMTTTLLIDLQDMHSENMAHEQELYEDFHSEMDKYLRNNFTDEVIRAKALETQQRQHHEADDVRKQYVQMLESKQRELEEVEANAEAELRRQERNGSKAIKESVAEYKRQVSKREEEINELRRDSNKLQERLVAIGTEKDDEYSNRIKAHEDTIESQRQQLRYEQERADKQGGQSIFLLFGMVIVGVAVGLIIGFVSANNKAVTPIQPVPAETIMVVSNVNTDSLQFALDSTFNQMFK